MSSPENDQYCWRETYFVWFDVSKRPSLKHTEDLVRRLRGHFELRDGEANERGELESLTVRAPEDHAALEIDYLDGEDVQAEGEAMIADLKPGDGVDPAKLARLKKCNARLDVMHFEQMADGVEEDELDEMLDPSALLVVLEALIKLTDGVGVDPQSGILM
jgi:hypothetical protein